VNRVVLVDPAGDIGQVAAALEEIGWVQPECATAVPSGPGVVALLVPPEVAVGAAELARLPDLRIVAATATGYDHLDLHAIAAAGVWATHCPGYCSEEVAEHAIAFVLALLRGIAFLDNSVRSGAWDYRQAPPRRVAGAVLGIVGLGRIGREVAGRARALGMRVIAADPAVDAERSAGVAVMPLHELLEAADVVTLHVPLTPATRGMIDAAALSRMRPGAFLVNCARAGLVDYHALGRALRAGHLGGCALDVLPDEPPSADQPALSWSRTLLSPHAAWFSPGSAAALYRRAAEAVAAVLQGREPPDAIARPRLCGLPIARPRLCGLPIARPRLCGCRLRARGLCACRSRARRRYPRSHPRRTTFSI
jgi:D-3-phosphoglycerate dehydrogenase